MKKRTMIKGLLLGVGLFVCWDGFGMVVSKKHPRSVVVRGVFVKKSLRGLKVTVRAEKPQATFPVEESQIYRLVTAEKLDHKALLGYLTQSDWFNERDRHGRTPLHYLMVHKEATVALVKHFMLHHGARYDIKDNEGDNPYCYGIMYDDAMPGESVKPELNGIVKEERASFLKQLVSRSKLLNFIHSEMICDKLWEYVRQESLMRSRMSSRSQKSTFYEIK